MRGPVGHHDPENQHVRVALLPTRQPLAEDLLGQALLDRPVNTGELEHSGVAPGRC